MIAAIALPALATLVVLWLCAIAAVLVIWHAGTRR